MVLCEYEQFFEMKFGKPPKLVKKIDDLKHQQLPKLSQSAKSNGGSALDLSDNSTSK